MSPVITSPFCRTRSRLEGRAKLRRRQLDKVPLNALVDGPGELGASGGLHRHDARPRGFGDRQRLGREPADADDRCTQPVGQRLGGADPDAHAGIRAGAEAHRDGADLVLAAADMA